MATVRETPGRATSWRVSAPEPRPPENNTTPRPAPRAPLLEDTAYYALAQRAAERVRARLVPEPDVAVDRAGNAGRLAAAAADRRAQIRILRVGRVQPLGRREPDVIHLEPVDA